MNISASAVSGDEHSDDRFDDLAEAVRRRVAGFARRPIFRAKVDWLFARYLDAFPAADRQHHTCNACRRFIERYGAAVVVDEHGATVPLIWGDDVPGHYAASVRALAAAVGHAPIEGVLLSTDERWGTGPTPDAKRGCTWTHFDLPSPSKFFHPIHAAGQAMAERAEEYGMLQRGLAEFSPETVQRACALLETDALYRSEKCLGVAKWLLDLHARRDVTKNQRARDNLTWLAVATAPAGFCHVRSTMIGTLRTSRPGSPSTTCGGASPTRCTRCSTSARRRSRAPATSPRRRRSSISCRRPADVQALWTSRPAAPAPERKGGVFAHLDPSRKPSGVRPIDAPPAVMTWEKFARTILPTAEQIECMVPGGRGPFVALVTAARPDAPPILQWDREEKRNPVSWYFYSGGSLAVDWNLPPGEYRRVAAIALSPAHWNADRASTNHGEMAILLLDGARDLRHKAGAALFPETLRSEYHGVRRTIEAYSNNATIAGRDEAEACGFALQKSNQWNATLRVTANGMAILYRLDRWD